MRWEQWVGYGVCGLLVLWIAYAVWQGYLGVFRWQVSRGWRRVMAWFATVVSTSGERALWGGEADPYEAQLQREVREDLEASQEDEDDVRSLVDAGAAPPRVRLARFTGAVWFVVALLSAGLLAGLLYLLM